MTSSSHVSRATGTGTTRHQHPSAAAPGEKSLPNTGGPIDPRNCTRTIQDACVAAGLPRIRLGDLRHGCVSVLLALGVPPRTVMEIVGHSTLEMTMNVYAHVTLDDKRPALDRFGDLLGEDFE